MNERRGAKVVYLPRVPRRGPSGVGFCLRDAAYGLGYAMLTALRVVGFVLRRLLWLGLCALLVLLEPVLRAVLVPVAFLSFLVTLVFGFAMGDENFPRWGMLAFSLGTLCLYWLFLALMTIVMRWPRAND
jgi:hypothetical protein